MSPSIYKPNQCHTMQYSLIDSVRTRIPVRNKLLCLAAMTAISVIVSLLLVCLVLSLQSDCHAEQWLPVHVQPEQIHLSLGENAQQMAVTWTTFDRTANSTVYFGTHSLDQVAHGSQTKFVDGGSAQRHMFIHRVYLSDLKPETTYRYHVGSTEGWSSLYTFRTFPVGHQWSPRFVVYGDLGNSNGRTIGQLQEEIQQDRYDLVLHVGDLAYDLHDDDAKVGDAFMRQIEPIAGYVPYQVCPGNHEQAYNFSNYDNRFTMHSEGDNRISNHFWSYNIGPVHVVSFSTEFHFFTKYGTAQIFNQYRWLEEDLKRANLPENRAKQPWIITMGHRPFYGELPDVDLQDEIIRKGNAIFPGFEDLFYKYGVDLNLFGHVHNYERMWPIYNNQVYNGSTAQPYTEPKAPIHITTGSAGCPEYLTPVLKHRPTYSAFILSDYGFTRMHVLNATHIHIEQTSEAQHGQVVDDFYVIKHKHGPEAWR